MPQRPVSFRNRLSDFLHRTAGEIMPLYEKMQERNRLAQQDAADERYRQGQLGLSRNRLGLERQTYNLQLRKFEEEKPERFSDFEEAYANAQTPEEREAIFKLADKFYRMKALYSAQEMKPDITPLQAQERLGQVYQGAVKTGREQITNRALEYAEGHGYPGTTAEGLPDKAQDLINPKRKHDWTEPYDYWWREQIRGYTPELESRPDSNLLQMLNQRNYLGSPEHRAAWYASPESVSVYDPALGELLGGGYGGNRLSSMLAPRSDTGNFTGGNIPSPPADWPGTKEEWLDYLKMIGK